MSDPRAEPTRRCAGSGSISMTRNTLKPAQVTQYLGKNSSSRIAAARMRSKRGTHSIQRMYSWLQRIRSLRHGVWYGLSERIRWSRGVFVETPAIELCTVDHEQAERIAALSGRYQVLFEQRMNADTSARNYEYLDLLDRGWSESKVERPVGGELCDIGCASFWYAAALHSLLPPGADGGRGGGGSPAVSRRSHPDRLCRGLPVPPAERPIRGRRLHGLWGAGGYHHLLVSLPYADRHSGVASAPILARTAAPVCADST